MAETGQAGTEGTRQRPTEGTKEEGQQDGRGTGWKTNKESQKAGQDAARGRCRKIAKEQCISYVFAKQVATNGTLYRVITVGD